jgi:hypothetical protein
MACGFKIRKRTQDEERQVPTASRIVQLNYKIAGCQQPPWSTVRILPLQILVVFVM